MLRLRPTLSMIWLLTFTMPFFQLVTPGVQGFNAELVLLLILRHLRVFPDQTFYPVVHSILLCLQALRLLFKGSRIIQSR